MPVQALCSGHHHTDPIEAETDFVNDLTYLVLRCPVDGCGKVRGARLIRRSDPRWASLQTDI